MVKHEKKMKRITINFTDNDLYLLESIDAYCNLHNIPYTTFFKEIASSFLPPSKEEVEEFFIKSLKSTSENANLFYEFATSMQWKDKNGRRIENWKSFALYFEKKQKQEPKWKTTNNNEDYRKLTNEKGEVKFN